MSEILSLNFMQNAFLGGILVSVICGVVGSLIVINKMSFIAGGVAHGAYGGIGIAFFLGISPIFGASVFALFLALVIAFISERNLERFDSAIGAIWAFGMAIGIIFIDITPGYSSGLMGYLFGSILAINEEILAFIGICALIFTLLIILFYRQLLAISFDAEFASLRGVNARAFYYLLVIMMAFSVVACIQVVGLILVIALITIPPFIAEKFSKKLSVMMILATFISAFFCISGLLLSYYFNLTSGAIIILIASICFFISVLIKK